MQVMAQTNSAVAAMVENVVTSLMKKEPKPTSSPASVTAPLDTAPINNIDDNEEDSNDNFPLQNDTALTPTGTSKERHINPERDNYNVDKIKDCWKCNERFENRKQLVKHLKEHNIDLPFKCYLCDASFDVRYECLMHQEKSHASDWAILKVGTEI